MRAILILLFLGRVATSAPAPRVAFSAKLGKVTAGMTADAVTKLLGAPDDIRTEHDPGGITAARTVEVWRYGTHGHGTFGTLGTVHIQADRKVQYVFGGRGTPYTGLPEPQLRHLLDLLDAVPSYNATLEPMRLVQAVNALVPLGKDRALAVVGEYLRVSSELDDPGREGVFLVMRALFDVPATGMPAMMVGSAATPTDPKALPRFPLVIVDDLPIKLVAGYALAGQAEPPEMDVAAFGKLGTLRSALLAPSPQALDRLEAYVAGPLGKAMALDDHLRVAIYDQALRAFATVFRPADRSIDGWFQWGTGKDIATRWAATRAMFGKLGARWDPMTSQLVLADGSTLPPLPAGFPRMWWDLALRGTTSSRVTFERKSDLIVAIEIRIDLAAGARFAGDALRLVDPGTGKLLATIDLEPIAAPSNSTTGSVMSRRLELPRGHSVRPDLVSGAGGPTLVP